MISEETSASSDVQCMTCNKFVKISYRPEIVISAATNWKLNHETCNFYVAVYIFVIVC